MRRISVSAGFLLALPLCLLALQGATQEAKTQSEGETQQAFAGGEIIFNLEDAASQADLRDLNQQMNAIVEEALSQCDVSLVDLPQGLSVSETVQAY